MKCPYCGSEFSDDYIYCPACGEEIRKSESEQKESTKQPITQPDKRRVNIKHPIIILIGILMTIGCVFFVFWRVKTANNQKMINSDMSSSAVIQAEIIPDIIESGTETVNVSGYDTTGTNQMGSSTVDLTGSDVTEDDSTISNITGSITDSGSKGVITSTPIPTKEETTDSRMATETPAASTPDLSDTAAATIKLPDGDNAPRNIFIFPDSSDTLLTSADLETLNTGDLTQMHFQSQLAIDEILIRYGFSFTGASDSATAVREKYSAETWYIKAQKSCPSNDSYELIQTYMNNYERKNIELINEWQKTYGIYY